MNFIEGQVAASPRATGMAKPREPAAIFYPRLEALRGVAALTVAAFHSWQAPWLTSVGQSRDFLSAVDGGTLVENLGAAVLRVVGDGYGAVVLFFVISGFVLSGSLVRGPQNLATGASRFLNSRLFRIYPAVFATIAIFVALNLATGLASYSALGLLRNALLLDTSIDGVMWSLQLELLAIPLIFVVYHGWLRWGAAALAAPFCLLAMLSFWKPWTHLIGSPNQFGEIYAFVLGMAAFLVAPRLIERYSPRIVTIVLTGAAALFLASRPVLGYASNWAALAEAIFGAIVVAVLAFGHPGGLATLLDRKLTRFFGRISYSFYLVHPLTLMVIWKVPSLLTAVITIGVPAIVVAAFLFVASAAAVTPLAFAMYRWVERPGVAAGRKLSKGEWPYLRGLPQRTKVAEDETV
jgi:peptidoglycan/LPS O-acetylase OafA/YrhL